MAIRDIVTGGFGNGTFSGTIALVVTRGYAIGEPPAEPAPCPYYPGRVKKENAWDSRVESQASVTYPSRPDLCS